MIGKPGSSKEEVRALFFRPNCTKIMHESAGYEPHPLVFYTEDEPVLCERFANGVAP